MVREQRKKSLGAEYPTAGQEILGGYVSAGGSLAAGAPAALLRLYPSFRKLESLKDAKTTFSLRGVTSFDSGYVSMRKSGDFGIGFGGSGGRECRIWFGGETLDHCLIREQDECFPPAQLLFSDERKSIRKKLPDSDPKSEESSRSSSCDSYSPRASTRSSGPLVPQNGDKTCCIHRPHNLLTYNQVHSPTSLPIDQVSSRSLNVSSSQISRTSYSVRKKSPLPIEALEVWGLMTADNFLEFCTEMRNLGLKTREDQKIFDYYRTKNSECPF